MKLSQSKYNRLTPVQPSLKSKVINNRKRWFVDVECDCGVKKVVNAYDLDVGKIKSCGCLSKITSAQNLEDYNESLVKEDHPNYKHGDSGTRFHNIWKHIQQRCGNPNSHNYPIYGGRGIKNKWQDYMSFREDMFESYQNHVLEHGEIKTSIDRINTDGHYSKENCRWATPRQQSNNQRKNRLITYKGKTQTVYQWSRELGIPRPTISDRINRQGLTDPYDILKV